MASAECDCGNGGDAVLAQDINWKQQKGFLQFSLNLLPGPYEGQDSNRVTLAFFVIAAMELLDATEKLKPQEVIDWVYSLQILPGTDREKNKHNLGFRGGPFFVPPFNPEEGPHPHDKSHIAMSYVAICLLLMMGDDLSRVDTKAVVSALPFMQQENGSFSPTAGGAEHDMRYIYCASSVSYMLNDWSGFNKESAINFILSSQGYDYSIGQGPLEEGHAGSTYCALASLAMMGALDRLPYKENLIKWLILRQGFGFQGRPNKVEDTCYSFWVGASLKLLGAYHLVEQKHSRTFTISCQQSIGGFAKWPDQRPDVLHSYMSLCGLAFSKEPGIRAVNPALCLSQRIVDRLAQIHEGKEGFHVITTL